MKEQTNFDVVESKSSVSQPPVTLTWATKFDTEEKDNYDSYDDDEHVFRYHESSKAHNEIEERQESSDDPFLDQRKAKTTWGCGVSGLNDHRESVAYTHFKDVLELAGDRRDHVLTNRAQSKENRGYSWACESSIRVTDNQVDSKLSASCDDEESSAAWFLNTFHPDDKLVVNKTSLKMIESHNITTSVNRELPVSEDKVEDMAAELEPLAFELDSFPAKDELEEEVIFYDETPREEASCYLGNPKLGLSTADESQGDEMFLKVTDAITSLCLTPRSQQQLLDGLNDSISSSTSPSTEDQNIELELRSSGNENGADEIVIVDAVVRALRRSKKRASTRTKSSAARTSSDTMDVLMSLAHMERGASIDKDCNEITGINLPITSTEQVVSDNEESNSATAIEAMDILANLNADNDSTNGIRESKDDEIANGYESVILEIELDRLESRESDGVAQFVQEVPENRKYVVDNDSTPIKENTLKSEGKEEKNSTETKEEKDSSGNEEDIESEPQSDKSPVLEQDALVLGKLELNLDSDSFSIDGFSDGSLVDDNPIRPKPVAMVKKIKTKTFTPENPTLFPRADFKNIATTISVSFDLVASLSSSDDCHIPTPPQAKNESVSAIEGRGPENPQYESCADPITALSMPTSNMKDAKKKKRREDSEISTNTTKTSSIPDPTSSTLRDSRRANKLFSHFAVNKMVRNGKKSSFMGKKRTKKNQKSKNQAMEEKSSHTIVEDSIRSEKKLYPLSSPSLSVEELGSLKEERETCSSNRLIVNQPESSCVARGLPEKGILRVKYEGAPKLPANTDRRRVHWDEKQLANKVEKGIMVGVSRKKCRPIRVLEKHMVEITAIQNGYANERESLLGYKSTSKGYIC